MGPYDADAGPSNPGAVTKRSQTGEVHPKQVRLVAVLIWWMYVQL